MRISNPFRYQFKEYYPSQGAVWKAWFGKKYFIWKAKALHQSVNQISKEVDQRLRLGTRDGDIYEKIVKYIKQARIGMFDVEAVLLTDDPAQLLITEHKLLKECQSDPDCLNTQYFPIVPKWIPETAVEEFQKYLAKLKAAKTASGRRKPGKKAAKKKLRGKSPLKKKAVKPVKKARAKVASRKVKAAKKK